MFAKTGNALSVGLDPIHEDDLPKIKQELKSIYPNVELDIAITEFWYVDTQSDYKDTIKKSSTVNKALPNGRGGSITDTIAVAERAIINSVLVSTGISV